MSDVAPIIKRGVFMFRMAGGAVCLTAYPGETDTPFIQVQLPADASEQQQDDATAFLWEQIEALPVPVVQRPKLMVVR